MKQHIENLIQSALKKLQGEGEWRTADVLIEVNLTKDKKHGDYASNIALVLAKELKKKPLEIAESIIKALPSSSHVQKIEIAGPGFINFFLSIHAFNDVLLKIFSEKSLYGCSKIGREKRILIEFVSSNPTGPLHVGHGRHGALGAIISNLLQAVGFQVYREYYVNDAGRQMDILAVSIWFRYLHLLGEEPPFPANAYRGDYVIDIAKAVHTKYGAHFYAEKKNIFETLPKDEQEGGDKEIYIDSVIERTKNLLGDRYDLLFTFGLSSILQDIREDLAEFGVHFDNWFSERDFVKTNIVDRAIEKLRENGHVYEREGALWFRSTDFSDEKDRVLVRSNGQRTYFANDVAYHLSKFERDFDLALDLFGADHHGYVPRMKAAMESLNIHPERLIHLLVQFVTLYRGHEQVQMSTRGGNFVTLRELRQEVGNDAARFFYVMRRAEQHIDFDLDLAKAQSNDNPVYYIQYAHARICSVFKQLAERHLSYDEEKGLSHHHLLITPHERQLLNCLSQYPEVVVKAALNYEPSLLTTYLRELATDFHSYYNSHPFLVEEEVLRDARLALLSATKQVLLNGFNLLGITAPQKM